MDHYIGLQEQFINDACIEAMGEKLDQIFGFKVGKKRKTAKTSMNNAMRLLITKMSWSVISA